MNIDINKFVASYKENNPLNVNQESGLRTILGFMSNDNTIKYLSWMSYMLATIWWETAKTWDPVREVGLGAGRNYGKVVTIHNGLNEIQNIYYGRGYVQLTWEGNYKRLGHMIGMGDELWLYPDKALIPINAYMIMTVGMIKGLFTGAYLGYYLDDTKNDYINARRVINGVDHAVEIAEKAKQIELLLEASITNASVSTQ